MMIKEKRLKQTEIGMIPEDWEVKPFGNVIEGKPRHGLYKPEEFFGAGTKVVKMGTHSENRFIDSDMITERVRLDESELRRFQVFENDLLFLRTSLVMEGTGKCSFVRKLKEPMTFVSNLFGVSLSRETANPLFYFYYFGSPQGRSRVLSLCEQTAAATIRSSDLVNLEIPYPPFPEQQRIAKILSDLDTEIELNQQMNRTLETIAKAVFKHWFIDFEFPNEEGKPYKSSGGEMDKVESEKIPRGWSVRSIGDILELAYGRALKDENRCLGKVPVYGSNGQIGWHDKALVDGPGIVVGRKGNPGIVTLVKTPFFPIDTTFYVVPKGPIQSIYYLFHALCQQDLQSLAADSAVPGLNRNIVYKNNILIPSSRILYMFDRHLRKLYNLVQLNNEQSHTVSAIRDALLAKLMSGKIRVPVEVR